MWVHVEGPRGTTVFTIEFGVKFMSECPFVTVSIGKGRREKELMPSSGVVLGRLILLFRVRIGFKCGVYELTATKWLLRIVERRIDGMKMMVERIKTGSGVGDLN